MKEYSTNVEQIFKLSTNINLAAFIFDLFAETAQVLYMFNSNNSQVKKYTKKVNRF